MARNVKSADVYDEVPPDAARDHEGLALPKLRCQRKLLSMDNGAVRAVTGALAWVSRPEGSAQRPLVIRPEGLYLGARVIDRRGTIRSKDHQRVDASVVPSLTGI